MFRAAKVAEKAELAKKKSISRLEQNKSLAEKEALVAEKEAFTFFETLSDPEMDKIVGLNNNIQSQPVVPPRPLDNKSVKKPAIHPSEAKEKTDSSEDNVHHTSFLSSPDNHESKSAALAKLSEEIKASAKEPEGGTGKEKNKKSPVSAESSAHKKPEPNDIDDDKTYTVQISSFKELAPAQSLQAKLQKKGYSAYLLSIDSPGKGVIYRVFLGKYVGQGKAIAAANKVRQEDKLNGVVVLLRE